MLLVLANGLSDLNNMQSIQRFVFLWLFASPILAEEPAAASAIASTVSPTSVINAGSIFQLFLGLAAVLVMIFISAWLVKRLGRWQGGHTTQLKVVGGLALGTRERIVLVQVGEQQILVGVTAQNINTLHVLDKPLVDEKKPNNNEPLLEKFSAILQKQRHK